MRSGIRVRILVSCYLFEVASLPIVTANVLYNVTVDVVSGPVPFRHRVSCPAADAGSSS